MSKSGFARVLAALVCVLSFGIVSCTSKFSESEQVEKTGTFNTALTSVGSDGATYEFHSNTMLLLKERTT